MKTNKNLTFAARAVMLRFSPQIILAGALALLVLPARADTFGSGTNTFTIDFVEIGNPGNGDDLGAGGGLYSAPDGGVDYIYRIGVTEVPQDWITKATKLGMTNVTAGAWGGSLPAANITWYDAAAFVNWLNTSKGYQPAYDLTHNGGWSMKLWSSDQAWQTGGENLYRHKGAHYFLPSEDEWYKAAFHKNDGVTANYWDYATGSNVIPTPVASGTGTGSVVYNQAEASGPATVDNNGGLSPYGTRGQNGNVGEFKESAFDGSNNATSESRVRGGGRYYLDESWQRSSIDNMHVEHDPSERSPAVGFRVASLAPIAAVVPGHSFLLPGDSVTLSLMINSPSVPSTYQWQFNGTNLPGATNATLALSNVTTNQSGEYSAMVTLVADVVTTDPSAVRVFNQLTITTPPQSIEAVSGTMAGFSVTAVGPLPITYQWQRNGVDLAGQTKRSLTRPASVSLAGDYTVVVSDANGSVVSQPVTLTVLVPPTVIQAPLSQSVVAGGSVTFSTALSGASTAPFTYEWRKGSSFDASTLLANVASAERTAFLMLTNVQPADAGTYRLYLANAVSPTITSTSPNRSWTLTVLADTDGDGLADAWETANGLNPNDPADANTDADSDGLSNLAEYRSGTSPTNAASRLQLESLAPTNGQALVSFSAAAFKTYTVEWNDQLSGGSWQKLGDVIARSFDRSETVTDSNAASPCRFYRIVTPRRP